MTKIFTDPSYRLTLMPDHRDWSLGDFAWAATTSGRSTTVRNLTRFLASRRSNQRSVAS